MTATLSEAIDLATNDAAERIVAKASGHRACPHCLAVVRRWEVVRLNSGKEMCVECLPVRNFLLR